MSEVAGLALEQLSPRELQIVEFAVLGMTDQQIANKLQISVSTVSSYWVRIRGKLGHMSRTEISGRLLKQRSLLETKRLKDLNQELKKKLEIEEARSVPVQSESLLSSVLAAGPYPMVAFNEEGKILFANERLATVLGEVPHALIGTAFSDHVQVLDVPGVKFWLESLAKLESGSDVVRNYLGLLNAPNGVSFRASITAGAILTASGRLYTCIIRPLVDEITNLRDAATDVLTQLE